MRETSKPSSWTESSSASQYRSQNTGVSIKLFCDYNSSSCSSSEYNYPLHACRRVTITQLTLLFDDNKKKKFSSQERHQDTPQKRNHPLHVNTRVLNKSLTLLLDHNGNGVLFPKGDIKSILKDGTII